MLEFDNVSKSFWTGSQRKVILDRVSFRVELGRSMGVLAPNGTGKTTLINMMAGLEKPDEGEIRRQCNVSFPLGFCLLYTSPSPRDLSTSRMPSSA